MHLLFVASQPKKYNTRDSVVLYSDFKRVSYETVEKVQGMGRKWEKRK